MEGAGSMNQLARRQFLISGSAAGAALALAHTLPQILEAETSGPQIGIQLYTVAADMTADPHGTLNALNKIGYREVETAGFAKLSNKDFRKALDDAGLHCPSAHLGFSEADPSPLFEDAHAVGAHYAVSSVLIAKAPTPAGTPSKEERQSFIKALANLTLDDFKRTADLANSIGAKAKQAGLQYAYHNHNFEFKDQGNGQTGYDLLLSQTDPDLVKFELDCGWMVAAGHNPVDYFSKYPNRYRMIHVKDFLAGSKPTTSLTGPDRPTGTELGKGHIDYAPIFPAASKAGVEYFFSEQEPPIVGMTALEAAKVNYDYMRSLK
jgi:sugar phosphate isomerase/epimerase